MDISWNSLWRILVVGVLVYSAYLMLGTISVLLLALVISTALDPIVDRLEEFRVPRILGTISVFLIALILLAFFLYTILPITLIELNSLVNNLGDIANRFLGANTSFKTINIPNTDIGNLTNMLLSGEIPFLQVLGKLVGGVVFAVTALVLSFYLTVGREGVEKLLRAVFPEAMEDKVISLYKRTSKKISKWFQAQLFLSFVVGSLVFTGLTLLGIKQSLVLGVIAAVFELVPVVGPIFAGALAVTVALDVSLQTAIYVTLFFLVMQQLENHILVPLVMKHAVGVNPVLVLIALLGGVEIAGIVGMLLAIPVVVFLQEVVRDWVAKKHSRSRRRLNV